MLEPREALSRLCALQQTGCGENYRPEKRATAAGQGCRNPRVTTLQRLSPPRPDSTAQKRAEPWIAGTEWENRCVEQGFGQTSQSPVHEHGIQMAEAEGRLESRFFGRY